MNSRLALPPLDGKARHHRCLAGALICLVLWSVCGCQSTTAPSAFNRSVVGGNSGAMAAASPRREFSPAEQAVAIEAIKRWHNERRSEANVYELDPYDRRISRGMRMALRSLFPPVPETVNREDQAFHTVALDDVKLPVGNYAYVVTRITNRYNASEYVDIFEYRENEWVLLNHYHIAEGLMDSALSDFSWAAYCAENNIDWSPE